MPLLIPQNFQYLGRGSLLGLFVTNPQSLMALNMNKERYFSTNFILIPWKWNAPTPSNFGKNNVTVPVENLEMWQNSCSGIQTTILYLSSSLVRFLDLTFWGYMSSLCFQVIKWFKHSWISSFLFPQVVHHLTTRSVFVTTKTFLHWSKCCVLGRTVIIYPKDKCQPRHIPFWLHFTLEAHPFFHIKYIHTLQGSWRLSVGNRVRKNHGVGNLQVFRQYMDGLPFFLKKLI